MTEATAGTILEDVPEADGFDAFLSSLKGEPLRKGLSTTTAEGATEQPGTETPDSTEESESTDASTEATEGEEPGEADPDDQEIEVKVGDKIEKAKLRELKRLFGQEASLTQKSQKLAEATKAAGEKDAQAGAALKAMLERADARFKPYAELDMLVLSQRMDTESFAALRRDAADAEADLKFLKEELGSHMRETQTRAQTAYREAATVCWNTLSDPAKGIKGWSQDLYRDISTWAAEQGAPDVRNLIDPAAWKIVHMAHQFARGQTTAKKVDAMVKAAPLKNTNVLKPGASRTNSTSKTADAMKALRQHGDIDSATDAFMASFKA